MTSIIRLDLVSWSNRKKCKKQELESLIGKLSFISKIVQPGRLFLRRLINLCATVRKSHHYIYMNKDSRADILWWMDFLPSWSHSTIIPESYVTYPSDLRLYTDACDYGFGAVYQNEWIQSQFTEQYLLHSIDFKELFAIVAAVFTWGSHWKGKRIVFYTDNKPISEIWQAGSTPSNDLMHLVRELYLHAARCQFSLSLKHISGTHNSVADSLSRYQMSRFHDLHPDAHPAPAHVPSQVLELLHSVPVPMRKKLSRN